VHIRIFPLGIAVYSSDNMYVSDAGNDRIQKISKILFSNISP